MNDEKIARKENIFKTALKRFSQIDGLQRAAAFAYYTFFALFPMIILVVSLASTFIDRAKAGQRVVALLQGFVPLNNNMQLHIFNTIGGVARARRPAGAVAVVILIWLAIQFLTILISATNRAGETKDPHWWRVPLKSLGLLGVLIGLALLGIISLTKKTIHWLIPPVQAVPSWLHSAGNFFGPLVILFISLALFYKLAPSRPVRTSHVWLGAFSATILMRTGEWLFVIYLTHFSKLNAIYGAFGGIMALLLWIYWCGCIFIYGACLSASHGRKNEDRNFGPFPLEITGNAKGSPNKFFVGLGCCNRS